MYRLLRAVLFLFPAEAAHRIGIWTLRLLGTCPPLCRWTRARLTRTSVDLSLEVAGLHLPNPIGLAAGLDKNAEAVPGLFALGFGSVEVGTLTPLPQPGNPKPRLFRILSHQALINRMGFNNCGCGEAADRLGALRWRPGPVGANIGKNKDTLLENATQDYLRCIDRLAEVSDYIVINASSPNTPGLRQLQEPQRLAQLLQATRAHLKVRAPARPLFLKIAPDLGPEAVDEIVDIACAQQIDGLVATNTTLARPFDGRWSSEEGGLSGAPLRPISTRIIHRIYARSAGRLPIFGVGGVFCADQAYEKIRAGASVVQLYTGLIYQGPGLVRRMLASLALLLNRDGFRSVTEAVGADHRSVQRPAHL